MARIAGCGEGRAAIACSFRGDRVPCAGKAVRVHTTGERAAGSDVGGAGGMPRGIPAFPWHPGGRLLPSAAGWIGTSGATMRVFLSALATAGMLAASSLQAAEFTPAVIFDMGGKFDKSFNEAAYNGAEKFKAETGLPYLEFEITNESQRDQALRRMAQRADIVIAVGFAFSTPLETISAEFPDK